MARSPCEYWCSQSIVAQAASHKPLTLLLGFSIVSLPEEKFLKYRILKIAAVLEQKKLIILKEMKNTDTFKDQQVVTSEFPCGLQK